MRKRLIPVCAVCCLLVLPDFEAVDILPLLTHWWPTAQLALLRVIRVRRLIQKIEAMKIDSELAAGTAQHKCKPVQQWRPGTWSDLGWQHFSSSAQNSNQQLWPKQLVLSMFSPNAGLQG